MRFDKKIIAAVTLIAVGIGAVGFVMVGPGIFSSGTSQQFITATATTTDVVKQVTATGTVIDKATYGLTFGQPAEIASSTSSTAASASGSGGSTSWSVETVQVTVGQTVTAGQVLATADTSDLEAQVAIAEANLASVESKLEIDQAGATPENAAVAHDSVSQAELSYTSTLQSQKDAAAQSAVSVNAARLAVEKARAQLAADQAGPSADEIASYQDQVNSAQLALTTAQQNLAQVQTQNAQAEKAAMDAVTNAQNQLAADQAGPSAAEIASYQDQVNSAQLALATAQQNLASAQAQNAQAESVAADAVTNALTQQWIDGCPGAPTPSPPPLQTPNPSPDPGKCDADQIALQNAENNLASLQVKNAASLQQAQTQVAQAQQALTAAQNNYTLKVTPSADVIAADQQALQNAQNNLASVQVKDAASLQQAQTQIDQAQVALTAAQNNYTLKVTPSAATIAADKAALTSAINSLNAAQVQASTSSHQYASQVAQANQSVTSAEHGYDVKVAPASAEQIAADQASVESSKVALTSAQQALALATLTSPIDGVVVAVNVVQGVVAPSGYALEVGTSSPQVTASVTESDFPSLKTGQTADVTITALDTTVKGTVTEISPTASTSGSSSVVTYTVVVSLVDAPTAVTAGMSADVSVTTASATNVIAVPSTALQGSSGNYTVRVMDSSSQVQSVTVEVGLVTTSMVEIASGISEGDTVVTGTSSSRSGTSTTNRDSGMPVVIPGGGGFPGGGPAGP